MFKIIHDLSQLSETERAQYCKDYASYLGLNPDENRIDTIWLNSDGLRALVAYCRRGTTDILRDIYNIDVVSMEREDGPGYVSYKATGVNRKGRREIAVGAFATEGLKGDKLAAAVATAETRAGRRMTLKFVGGGLLDESEVTREPVTTPNTVAVMPAVQPEVKPNEETGKLAEAIIGSPETLLSPKTRKKGYKPVEPAPAPLSEPALISVVEQANAILAAETPKEEVKKPIRRGRPKKNEVDMGDIEEAQPAPEPKPEPVLAPLCPDCKSAMALDARINAFMCVDHGRMVTKEQFDKQNAGQPETPKPVLVAPEVKPPVKSPLTPEEQKSVKERLSPFWAFRLTEEGGMTADDGLSVNGKLTKYANQFFIDNSDSKTWKIEKWNQFIEYIQNVYEKQGAVALVAEINKAIRTT